MLAAVAADLAVAAAAVDVAAVELALLTLLAASVP